jgi:hypothetical protein
VCRKGPLSCHTCCATGPRFFRSHPKDRPIQSPFTTHEGMWRIYSNPDPHGVPKDRSVFLILQTPCLINLHHYHRSLSNFIYFPRYAEIGSEDDLRGSNPACNVVQNIYTCILQQNIIIVFYFFFYFLRC